MKVAKRDWIFIAVIGVTLGALFMSTGREKAAKIPYDDKHRPYYEAVLKGGDRMEMEKGCGACHGIRGVPLSRTHPPKEQCLLCHKLTKASN